MPDNDKKKEEYEKKLSENPVEFMIDFFIDMAKSFKEGLTGEDKKKKDPMEQMQEMMQQMMQMFQIQQQMQMQMMQYMQKQMDNYMQAQQELLKQAMEKQKTQEKQAEKETEQAEKEAAKKEEPQKEEKQPEKETVKKEEPLKEEKQPEKETVKKEEPLKEEKQPEKETVKKEEPLKEEVKQPEKETVKKEEPGRVGPMTEAPQSEQEAAQKRADKNAPEQELNESVKELKEANKAYREAKAENDALKAEAGGKEFQQAEKTIKRAQAEMDRLNAEMNRLTRQFDFNIKEDDKALNKDVDEASKYFEGAQAARTNLAFTDNFNPDGQVWSEETMQEVETQVNTFEGKGKSKAVQDAINTYSDSVRDFAYKNAYGQANAEDTIKTYDAAKNFLNATRPKMQEIKEGPDKGKMVPGKVDPDVQKLREGAQKLVGSIDSMKEGKIRERAAYRMAAKANNKEFNPAGVRDVKWFSQQELNGAILSLDQLKGKDGKLSPGAEKFQNALKDLRGDPQKDGNTFNAGAYINAYKAADDFMQEAIKSGKGGPHMDAVKQVAKDVRQRLNQNDRIDKLKAINEYEKRREAIRVKAAKLDERRAAQERRVEKRHKVYNQLAAARTERNKANSMKQREVRKKLEESAKKLEDATKRREAARTRSQNASKRVSSRTQNPPQKKAMGMGM